MRKNDSVGREKLMMQLGDNEVNCNNDMFTIVVKSWHKKLTTTRLEILSKLALLYLS